MYCYYFVSLFVFLWYMVTNITIWFESSFHSMLFVSPFISICFEWTFFFLFSARQRHTTTAMLSFARSAVSMHAFSFLSTLVFLFFYSFFIGLAGFALTITAASPPSPLSLHSPIFMYPLASNKSTMFY